VTQLTILALTTCQHCRRGLLHYWLMLLLSLHSAAYVSCCGFCFYPAKHMPRCPCGVGQIVARYSLLVAVKWIPFIGSVRAVSSPMEWVLCPYIGGCLHPAYSNSCNLRLDPTDFRLDSWDLHLMTCNRSVAIFFTERPARLLCKINSLWTLLPLAFQYRAWAC